jgi:hypothetical protein
LTGKRRDQLNGSAISEFRVRCAEAKIGSTEPVQSLFRYVAAVVGDCRSIQGNQASRGASVKARFLTRPQRVNLTSVVSRVRDMVLEREG